MKNDSGVMHQAINVDESVTQCVLNIHFSPNPAVNPSQSSTDVPDGKLLLRINDAAQRLSLSRTNLYKIPMSGELEGTKAGRSRLIPTDTLESFAIRN